MAEIDSQGISRRDLLKRGAALGGAVVWATPVVQTLGMGRAFASTASPTGTAISYIAITWRCGDGTYNFSKNEEDGTANGSWEPDPGSIPGCEGALPGHPDNMVKIDNPPEFSVTYDGNCATIVVDGGLSGCEINYVLKGGQEPCKSGTLSAGSNPVCLS